jgi:hypothetical protein
MTNVVRLSSQPGSVPLDAVLDSFVRLGADIQRRVAGQAFDAIASHVRELDVIALKYLAVADALPDCREKVQVLRNIAELRLLIHSAIGVCGPSKDWTHRARSHASASPVTAPPFREK